MVYLSNAFSIQMLSSKEATVCFRQITWEEARELIRDKEVQNVIGHEDLFTIVKGILQIPLPEPKKVSVQITKDDTLIVAQYTGPRLPNGATQLPEGAVIVPWLVKVEG